MNCLDFLKGARGWSPVDYCRLCDFGCQLRGDCSDSSDSLGESLWNSEDVMSHPVELRESGASTFRLVARRGKYLARLLLSRSSSRRYGLLMRDVAHSSLLADEIPPDERFPNLPPPCVELNSAERLGGISDKPPLAS